MKPESHSVELLREYIYADDFVAEVASVEEGIRRTKQIKLEAGMNLCKWLSSPPLFFNRFNLLKVNVIQCKQLHKRMTLAAHRSRPLSPMIVMFKLLNYLDYYGTATMIVSV